MTELVHINRTLAHLIDNDPVRPELDYNFRINNGRECLVLKDNDDVSAVICVAYNHQVPKTIDELDEFSYNEFNDPNSIAVFYTVWSYKKGSGRDMVFTAVDYILHFKPWVRRFVTLSPKTEMARKFHLGNGAFILGENKFTDNYEYLVQCQNGTWAGW